MSTLTVPPSTAQAVAPRPFALVRHSASLAKRSLIKIRRTPEALIFTDVFGATPCNIAQRLADGVQVKVVAGVNVPMLWRSLCYSADSLDSVMSRAVAGATQGVMQVATSRPQNQTRKAVGSDQKDHQDQ